MFNKVLIATDGSLHAQKAVLIGGDLAAKNNSEVILVHVLLASELDEDLRHMLEVEHLVYEFAKYQSGETSEQLGGTGVLPVQAEAAGSQSALRALGTEILTRAEASVKAQGAKRVSSRLLEGNVISQIMKSIKDEHPDVVVCGAKGLSTFEQLVLGSVSMKIAQLCPVTCVTVR
ncbi:universal stress protein [Agrobacterium tumefaciens]|uniref:universal stress protein n=1 Tax=Agrobacterium tumefaciens TaxID=358 RepID=UPI0004707392